MARHSLSNLSDNKLLADLRKLVKKEKKTTLSILLHLAEVDRRELYLGYGFSSLYDYCIGALNYSRSAAGRRISTARCIRRYPEIYDLLDSDEVSSSTIGLVAPILDDENKDLLLREIRGKSRRQVETIVAAFKPAIAFRDRVTPVRVAVPDVGQNAKNRRNSLVFNSRRGSNSPGGNTGSAARSTATHSVNTAGSPQQTLSSSAMISPAHRTGRGFLVQFLASERLMVKLDEVKSILSNNLPAGKFEDVFEAVIDEFLERHSPAKRQQRRDKRKYRALKPRRTSPTTAMNVTPAKPQSKTQQRRSQRATSGSASQANTSLTNRPASPSHTTQSKQTRHIPAAVRDKVYLRDDGQCTYVGKNGKRCRSTHNLQIDHIKPFACGGSNTLRNLRLLCGKHNRLEAKRLLGKVVMNRFTNSS
jgi:5-methylcytosine-specific restriction endonuclease McrA